MASRKSLQNAVSRAKEDIQLSMEAMRRAASFVGPAKGSDDPAAERVRAALAQRARTLRHRGLTLAKRLSLSRKSRPDYVMDEQFSDGDSRETTESTVLNNLSYLELALHKADDSLQIDGAIVMLLKACDDVAGKLGPTARPQLAAELERLLRECDHLTAGAPDSKSAPLNTADDLRKSVTKLCATSALQSSSHGTAERRSDPYGSLLRRKAGQIDSGIGDSLPGGLNLHAGCSTPGDWRRRASDYEFLLTTTGESMATLASTLVSSLAISDRQLQSSWSTDCVPTTHYTSHRVASKRASEVFVWPDTRDIPLADSTDSLDSPVSVESRQHKTASMVQIASTPLEVERQRNHSSESGGKRQRRNKCLSTGDSPPPKPAYPSHLAGRLRLNSTESRLSSLGNQDDLVVATDVDAELECRVKSDGRREVIGARSVTALVVAAALAHEAAFSEAFLLTYHSFLTTPALVEQLQRRYSHFAESASQERASQHTDLVGRHETLMLHATNTADLVIRVAGESVSEVAADVSLRDTLQRFSYCLVAGGRLSLAGRLRECLLASAAAVPPPRPPLRTAPPALTSFKSQQIAEQLCLIDQRLFLRVPVAEMTRMARTQSAKDCPALTSLTTHFNQLSYWARTVILTAPTVKDRDAIAAKLVKVCRCLREMNDFAALFALTAALDTAAVSRLWPSGMPHSRVLSRLSCLADSSSSFKRYRAALRLATPPTVPYIGVTLQDLTHVEVRRDGSAVDFRHCWQQARLLAPLLRCRAELYSFSRDPQVIAVFGDFESALSDDACWNLSEQIRPM